MDTPTETGESVSADDILKDPYVFEFLPEPPQFESELEQSLIDSLQPFLLELGQGFTFTEIAGLHGRNPLRSDIIQIKL